MRQVICRWAPPSFCTLDGTPGFEASDNATVVLGEENEPQPDLFLRILPQFGGQTRTTKDQYVEDAPELVAEIAHSSRAIYNFTQKRMSMQLPR